MAQAYTSGAVPNLVVGVGLQHALKHGAWLPPSKSGASPARPQTALSGYAGSTRKLTKLVILTLCRRP